MLVAVQLPLADCRPFVEAAAPRPARPAWDYPRVDEAYVRGFGGFKKRVKDGRKSWPGEAVYCRAGHAVRLPPLAKDLPEPGRRIATSFSCAFRRLLVDGKTNTIARFEAGFTESPGCRRLFPMPPAEVSRLLKTILSRPVRIPSGSGAGTDSQLAECGKALAAHFLRATTARSGGKAPATEAWWIAPGSPMTIMEYGAGEIAELPPYCMRVPGTEEWDVDVHHLSFQHKGRQTGVWFLGRKKEPLPAAARDTLQRLWLQLLKLHAERECLQQILLAIAEKKIPVTEGNGKVGDLTDYLDASIDSLSHQKFADLPQADIQFAQQFDDLVDPDRRQDLLAQLASVRKTLYNKVARASGEARPGAGAPAAQPIDVFVSYAHADKTLCEELQKYLAMLRRQGLIRDWYDRGIVAGSDWPKEIDERLNTAGVILLLISADFLNSDYCFDKETTRALERRTNGEAVVVPVLLRDSDWRYPPLSQLEPLPKDFKAIELRVPQSTAFTEVAAGIRELVESLRQKAEKG